MIGPTIYGGIGYGAMIQIPTGGTTVSPIMNLNGGANGSFSYAKPVKAPNGKFYSTVSTGGASSLGGIIEINSDLSSYTLKVSFTGTVNGANPYGELFLAGNGKFYGTTKNGGANNFGTIFSYVPGGTSVVKEHDFNGTGDGSGPMGGFIEQGGKLYGTASAGATFSMGYIYEFNYVTSTLNPIHTLQPTSGSSARSSFVIAQNGDMYTTCRTDGANGFGTIFRIASGGGSISIPHNFVGGTSGGANPEGPLTPYSANIMYGMTPDGGANGFGCIYEFNTSTNIVTLRYSFQNTGDGANPKGGLTLSTFNGKLYGMTSLGGVNNYGVIFEFNPVGFVYTKLADLTSTTGTSPDKMSFLEYLPLTATISGTNTTCNGFCTGSATVTPNGGTAPYTYSWAPVGGTAATASSLCAGSYTCTITEAGGTVITKTITITQPAVLVATPSTQTNVSCNGGSNGTASVIASGGTPGYTYNWGPGNPTGDGTASVTGLIAGTWACTVTDLNGCFASSPNITINQPTALGLTSASQINISCFGGSNGAATVNAAAGGTPGYTYNWTPGNPTGDGTLSVSGLIAANWTCTVTDANSCTAIQTFNVTQPTALVVSTLSQTNVSCNAGTNGAASVSVSGGTTAYTYNWTPGNPTGDGTASVTGLAAGSWTCTVTDANGCVGSQIFTITQPSALVVSSLSQTNVSCNAGTNGAASVSVSGGTTAYTYNWTPGNPTGDGTASATGLTAGSWTCTVTDANSCVGSQIFTITQPSALVVSSLSQTNVSCNAGTNGAASVSVSGGTTAYTYNWTPGNPTGDGTASVTGLTAGSWTCTVTDANGCVGSQIFTITQPSALVVSSLSQTNVSCNAGTNGAASVSVSGGTTAYTYNWTPGNPTGDGTASATGLTAGSWTCTVTDANSCVGSQIFTITQPSALVVSSLSQTNVSCNAGTNGAASVSVSGGTTAYTYNWTPGNPTGDGTASVTGLTAGSWTCTVTDANSCVGSQIFTITQPSALVVSNLSQTNVSCNAGTNGAASVSVSGGTTAYTYNWTPGNPTGDGTASVTGLTAGSWTCTVTDANSCVGSQTFTITQPSALVVSTLSQTNVSCNAGTNGAASVSVSGGTTSYTYNWTPGNPTGDGTASVTGLAAGSWTCTVTDANSCVGSQIFTITQPTALVVSSLSQTNVSCNAGTNGAASVSVSGGTTAYTYNWTPGNPTGDGTASVTGLAAGSWTCTVTDANGCVGSQIFTITQPSALVVSNLSQTNVSCNAGTNGAASVSVSGGTTAYTYNWTPGNPTGDGTASVTGLTAGSWTCSVTDANSCVGSQIFTITQPSALVVSNLSQTNVSCNAGTNGAASVSVSGGTTAYTYNWTPGNPTGDGTASVTGLTAGSWTCTVTDANGCVGSQIFTITQPSALVVSNLSQTNILCNAGTNGAANVSVTGGTTAYTYNWTPGNPTGDGTASVTGLTAGTWTCTVTDANSCVGSQIFTITEPTSLVVSNLSQTNILCNAGTNGEANVSVSGGTTAYTYNWTPGNPTGDGTANLTGLTAGSWTCTVTDANGCVGAQIFTITEPTSLVVSNLSQTNILCNAGTNGEANVSVSGGTTAYTYNWTPGNPTGDGTANVTGLTAGSWTCTVTDANGCVGAQIFTITEPTALSASIQSQTNVLCNGLATGAASISVLGGTPTYTYAWLPSGGTSNSISSVSAGSYTCNVTDDNSCVTNQVVTITEPIALTTTTSNTNSTCGSANGSASTIASGGTGAYNYLWDAATGGQTTATATSLSAGSYTVTITDANSCSINDIVSVSDIGGPTLSTTVSNILCNAACNGSITVNVTGGSSPFTYAWDAAAANQTTATAINLCAGSYGVVVTDNLGCISSISDLVTEPTAIIASTDFSSDVTCFSGSNGSATVSATGGAGFFVYSWAPTGGVTAIATGLTALNYTVTISDANACTITHTVTINEPTQLIASASEITNAGCIGGTNGVAQAFVTGGIAPYSYSWNTGSITDTETGLGLGTYTCSVMDNNSCTTNAIVNINENNHTDLFGNLNFGSNTILSGYALAFKQQPSTSGIDTVAVIAINGGASANYLFTGLAPDNYFVKILLDTTSHPTAVPTYYGDAFQWDSSLVVNHGCLQTDTADINVIELLPASPTATGTISGFIIEGPGYQALRLFNNGTTPNNPFVPGGPLKGIDVKLGRNPGGGIQARTTSDTTGYFNFDSIPDGNYTIYVDIPNLPMDSTRKVDLTAGSNTSVQNNYYADSVMIYIDTNQVVGIYSSNKVYTNKFSIYPNPSASILNLQFTLLEKEPSASIEINDALGHVVYKQQTTQLIVGDNTLILKADKIGLKAGVYFVNLITGNKRATQRIVILE
jgi:uncharacterized repeat protein (TIGR03803 family)